jgi:hypothetical protein
MAQTLIPLYGDYISSVSIAQALTSMEGILIKPSASLALPALVWQLTLAPDPALIAGIWAWKTSAGEVATEGVYVITESAPVVINCPVPDGNYWVVARWKWTAGPVDIDGHPTGEHTISMLATYAMESAPSDFLGAGSGGTVEQPYLANRYDPGTGTYGVILGRVTVLSGTPTFAWEPSTLTDLSWIGAKIAAMQAEIDLINTKIDPITIQDSVVTANYYTLKIESGVLTQTLVV